MTVRAGVRVRVALALTPTLTQEPGELALNEELKAMLRDGAADVWSA